jgi:hypothetical protein
MYSTCLLCADSLGTNAVLETLPVGRRVAFDPAKGRLWVVCPGCARWNLVPFDSRFLAIEDCERHFRDTHVRFSTGTIGIARLPEGLELVRIGPALRPEFAAWRYGRELLKRRRGGMSFGVPRGHTGIATVLSDLATMIGTLVMLPFLDDAVGARHAVSSVRLVRDPHTGNLLRVRALALVRSMLTRHDGAWSLEVPYRSEVDVTLGDDPLAVTSIRDFPSVGFFRGSQIHDGLSRVLPTLERTRPTEGMVREATRLLERTTDDPDLLYSCVAGRPLRFETRGEFPLVEVAPEVRLALEMTAHEETERRALAGELTLLEREWRDAERLAAISDALSVPASIEAEYQARSHGGPNVAS